MRLQNVYVVEYAKENIFSGPKKSNHNVAMY